jgi:hypothetical protein
MMAIQKMLPYKISGCLMQMANVDVARAGAIACGPIVATDNNPCTVATALALGEWLDNKTKLAAKNKVSFISLRETSLLTP